ncbi:cysteine dioxygenase [Undibacterium sp.]|jgi:predicted metal-dependent enzyme (double-stranded beta helix superfamily)|uniref:cysteine dioxygenase family protein n=1 Tax=Undibacterium sp. TaxID=1914977 RepID=UPI002D0F45AE|nr:cysteine dioxygenase [Undibacterium sp.]HTD05768.1 cysteine dioxygenase [Undibacterium sp.]
MPNNDTPAGPSGAKRFQDFILRFSALLDRQPDEALILEQGGALLRELLVADDWLPDAYARPDPEHYQQFLLHADPGGRFSVVSFVWGPGQATPIHNHTVWGLIGMLRGAELSQKYASAAGGALQRNGDAVRLEPGEVEAVSPGIGDIHQVSNAYADRVSVSIHVYGANIGEVQRAVFYPDGSSKPFVSGYSTPNLT